MMLLATLLVALGGAMTCCASGDAHTATQSATTWTPGTILEPPANVTDSCLQSAFGEFTRRYAVCSKQMWYRKDPDHECCTGFAEFYGPNSTRPSRNCWCSKEVMDWWAAAEEFHYYSVKTALLVCSRLGFVVGFYEEETGGYCNGTAPTDESVQGATYERHSSNGMRSLSDWLKAVENDQLVSAAVATGVMSAVGLSFMLWPIAIELVLAAKESLTRRRRAA